MELGGKTTLRGHGQSSMQTTMQTLTSHPLITSLVVALALTTGALAQFEPLTVNGSLKISGVRLLSGNNQQDATVQSPASVALVLERLDADSVVISSNSKTGALTAAFKPERFAFGNKELLQLTLASSNVKGFSLALTNRLVDDLTAASFAAVNAADRTSAPVRALVFTNFNRIVTSVKETDSAAGDLLAKTGAGAATFSLIIPTNSFLNVGVEGTGAGPVSFNDGFPVVTPDGVTNLQTSVKLNARVQTAPVP
jgi:hypothetical protein